jgi:hypothetical protein
VRKVIAGRHAARPEDDACDRVNIGDGCTRTTITTIEPLSPRPG